MANPREELSSGFTASFGFFFLFFGAVATLDFSDFLFPLVAGLNDLCAGSVAVVFEVTDLDGLMSLVSSSCVEFV